MLDINQKFLELQEIQEKNVKFPWNLEDDHQSLQKELLEIETGKQNIFDKKREKFLGSCQVVEIQNNTNFSHHVSIPENLVYQPLRKNNIKYKTFSFSLDQFQTNAISCIENDQNVFVSAPTSSGKTVVAEYAIAKCLKKRQRIIYTSPIKALSNQKFKDFYSSFKDVGLHTGDTVVNQDASCLVMTTEILRNVLYKSSKIMKNVTWVIMDEAHYLRDEKRGVVWEELIIMLPDSLKLLFLSATIPNIEYFCKWVSIAQSQPCHFIQSSSRPVPLEHSLYSQNSEDIYPFFDCKGIEHSISIDQGIKTLASPIKFFHFFQSRCRKLNENINNLKNKLLNEKLFPVIFFIFSRPLCDQLAQNVFPNNFNTSSEKNEAELIIKNALSKISEDDQKSSQIFKLSSFLSHGIGVHHAGIIPILKEITEFLFSKNLIKFLFATETFSLGINMPARTVVFLEYEKPYNGIKRSISASEYTQMSGRAGRRGKDNQGTSIIVGNDCTTKESLLKLIKGDLTPLTSAFRITYATIINLFKKGVNPEFMMKRSLLQYEKSAKILDLEIKILELVKKYQDIKITVSKNFSEYIFEKLKKFKCLEILKTCINETQIENTINPGQIIKIKKFGWGCICSSSFKTIENSKKLLINVLINKNYKYEDFQPEIVELSFDEINLFGSQLQNFSSDNAENLKNILSQKKHSINFLDKRIYKIDNPLFNNYVENYKNSEIKLKENAIGKKVKEKNSETIEFLKKCIEKLIILQKIIYLKEEIKEAQKIVLKDDLDARIAVLNSLGYLSKSKVELKGIVCSEIRTSEELIITELIFNGFFENLNEAEIFGAVACFVYEEKPIIPVDSLNPSNQISFQKIKETAQVIYNISKKCEVKVNYDVFMSSFKCDLMDTFYQWANGEKYVEICSKTKIYEGTIVRCIRRGYELLTELEQAAKYISDNVLEMKIQSTVLKIRRDVVFCESLYLMDAEKICKIPSR